MRISDWSSDVCSSDLHQFSGRRGAAARALRRSHARRARRRFPRAHGRAVHLPHPAGATPWQIGRPSSRERVCHYVSNSVVDGDLNTQTPYNLLTYILVTLQTYLPSYHYRKILL